MSRHPLQKFHVCIAKDTYYVFSKYDHKPKFRGFKWYDRFRSSITYEAERGDALSFYWSNDSNDYYPYGYMHEYTYLAYKGSGLSALPTKFRKYKRRRRHAKQFT